MFEVSSLRTNTSSKSFAPLINSHVDSRLFKAAPNFSLCFSLKKSANICQSYSKKIKVTQFFDSQCI